MRHAGRLTPFMGGYAADDRAWLSPKEAGDLGVAVASFWVMAHQPPQLVASRNDGSGSTRAAEFFGGNTAAGADGADQVKQAAHGERGEYGIGVSGWGHGILLEVEGFPLPLPALHYRGG